ncbi:MAG TPA: GNAT family N-acetyltransferase [Bacillota bacterium]|nr:GNAT family N-acetyltransferase [Bacillota bacterium]
MHYRIQENCENVDWALIRDSLKRVGMGYHEPELHRKAFHNSFAVVFLFQEEQLIGFGRALCDGAYQGAVYDVVVLPEFQGQGLGKVIMNRLLEKLPHCNVILYASPGKEEFYAKLGFARMTTGMARFLDPAKMRERGMIGG